MPSETKWRRASAVQNGGGREAGPRAARAPRGRGGREGRGSRTGGGRCGGTRMRGGFGEPRGGPGRAHPGCAASSPRLCGLQPRDAALLPTSSPPHPGRTRCGWSQPGERSSVVEISSELAFKRFVRDVWRCSNHLTFRTLWGYRFGGTDSGCVGSAGQNGLRRGEALCWRAEFRHERAVAGTSFLKIRTDFGR